MNDGSCVVYGWMKRVPYDSIAPYLSLSESASEARLFAWSFDQENGPRL